MVEIDSVSCVRAENDLLFVLGAKIDLVFEWVVKIGLVLVRRPY